YHHFQLYGVNHHHHRKYNKSSSAQNIQHSIIQSFNIITMNTIQSYSSIKPRFCHDTHLDGPRVYKVTLNHASPCKTFCEDELFILMAARTCMEAGTFQHRKSRLSCFLKLFCLCADSRWVH